MGVITLKIDDELEKSLRARAGQVHGVRKGSISASVEDAIRVWLREGETEVHGEARLYVAMLGEKRVADAPSLQSSPAGSSWQAPTRGTLRSSRCRASQP